MVRVRIFIYTSLLFLFTLVFNMHIYAMEEIVEDYSYTGNYQEFTAPYTGEYKLEVWGAGGGGQHQASYSGIGGLGGYSQGLINLKKGDTLYIYVGGEGKTCITAGCTAPAGWNGGGTGYKKYGDAADPVGSGGGATDIRLVSGNWNDSDSLLSRIIVAGGGGGGGMETNERGGDGGGLSATRYNNNYGAPGTQTKGWAFGYGYSCSPATINYVNTTWGGSGAGGGWYGGYNSAGSGWHSAGGGSGFIWTEEYSNNVPEGYSVESRYYLSDATTLAGNQTVPKHDGTGTMTGTRGNGHAKISLVRLASPLDVTFPITSDNLDFSPFYEEGSVDIEVIIPESPFETTISYDTNTYIWGNNVGKVTLEDGKTIEVVLMDRNGEIFIYTITSTLGRAKLDNVVFDKATYEFEKDVYEYTFTVDYSVKEFNPIIEASEGISYTQSNSNLIVGENIIKIDVSGDNLKPSTYVFKITRNYKEFASPKSENFSYTGNYQEFVAPYTTDYILEVWGASGGGNHQYSDSNQAGVAGRGGYSTGTVRLNQGDKIYIYVGGQGSYKTSYAGTVAGGYNGGGYAWKTTNDHWTVYSGGGATDVRLVSGNWNNSSSLLSRIIVAGGGGGGSMQSGAGGYGGGLTGGVGNTNGATVAGGGQTTSGLPAGASFGKGADSTTANGATSNWGSSGAGGGWYGGGVYSWGSAGGGSGYVWTEQTKQSVPSGYIPTSNYYLTNAKTVAGNQAIPNYNNSGSNMTGNLGNGYARITYYNPDDLDELINISVDKGEMTPEFSSRTLEYDLILNLEDTEITINAETLKGEGLVTGTGTFTVDAGVSDHVITFTNTQGTVTTYIIHISRPASSDANIKGFKVNGILYDGFDASITEYDIEIPTEVEKINLELLKAYPGQIIPTDTIYDFHDISLTKTIVVESEKNLSNQIYTFNFTRKKSSELKSLTLTSTGQLNKIFSPKIHDYDLEIFDFVREVPIEAIPYFPNAKVSVVENRYVGIDDKQITITVDLEGVPSTVYTLNIKRVEPNLEPVDEGYSYTGDVQEFIAPNAAFYTLEVWGASGGGNNLYSDGGQAGIPGRGGYSRGTVYLNAGEKLYIYVGGQGSYKTSTTGTVAGGFNGGGYAWKNTNDHWTVYSGGGATDIRFVSGTWNASNSLLSRLIVAGGGGGASMQSGYGGAGGGVTGGISNQFSATPGTQTNPAKGASFGKGADSSVQNGADSKWGSSGGGGGWYGGGISGWGAGAGGSGFVWTKDSSKNVPEGYSVSPLYYLKDAETIAGNLKVPTLDGTNLMTGNTGNGYARITANPGIVGDTFLDSIVVDNNTSLIEFYPWELTYDIELSKEYDEVLIEATPKSSEATLVGTGMIKLKPGLNEHKIVVSTEDGASKTYTLNITREPSDDSAPQNILIKNPQAYLCGISENYCKYTFEESKIEYDILIPFETEQITFEAVLKSEYQSVKYYTNDEDESGNAIRKEVSNGIYNLHTGLNNIEVDIISEDGNHTTTYVYRIMKDDAGNNNLLSLKVINPLTPIDFNPYVYEYYFDIDAEYSELELEVIPQNPKATVEIMDNENFVSGMNDVRIAVTAPNGNNKTYILHVFKNVSTNTFLSDLSVTDNDGNNVELTPIFQKVLTDYSASVSNDISSININAVSEGGTVTGDGVHTLVSGNNEFKVTVTSESGDILVYNINIFKARNSNSNLLNIEVDGYTLSPTFDKDTKLYSITVPKSVTKLDVIVTPEEETTTYTIKGDKSLTNTKNSIIITSVAEDKSYQVYEIVVNKEEDTNNYLKEINLSSGAFNETFNKETLSYTLNVSGNVQNITINGIPESEFSVVKGNGTYALIGGENIITLVVTSEDRSERTYTIKVTRELDDDVSLKSVTNSLGSDVVLNTDSIHNYDYLINVQYGVKDIVINGIPNSNTSVVSGAGHINLVPGDNDITLRVTSEKGTFKDYVVRVVRDLSNNDDLKFLYVEEGGLSPKFNRTTIYYNVKVPYEKTSLNIDAIPEDKDAKVEINGDVTNLVVGESRIIEVIVTAPNNIDKKIYTLNVVRQEDTTENLSLLSLETNRGELTPLFNPDVLNYELTVENDITDINVTASALDSENVIIKGTGNYNLIVGKNAISVFVISKETGIQRDYQIVVTRKVSNDATLKNLVVKGHTLEPSFNKNVDNYSISTSDTSLEFSLIQTTESTATYEIIGNENFVSGNNTVIIRVTAPDGSTTKDYTLTAVKARSKNNNLASLSVQGQVLTPVFHKGVTFYTVDVPRTLNSVIIEATLEDNTSTLEGTGLKTLDSGENYFNITVTSEAGTKKTYTILINKEASDNNYLSSLIVSEGTLNPVFNKNTPTYNIVVPYTVNEITVSGTLEDVSSSQIGFGNYTLKTGDNNISIVVTSESGDIRVYSLVVTKESIISSYLTSLSVPNYDFEEEFMKELMEYYVTVDYEVSNIEPNYTLEDVNASVIVSGNTNLKVGMNEVHIKVTSSDGSMESDYIIYVNRKMSTNNFLSVLSVDGYLLEPTFNPEVLVYNLTVPRDVESVNVTAITQDVSATILSGVGTHNLKLGLNTIEVKVKSMIGITRIYKVNIIREQSSNNYLQSLVVSNLNTNLELTPSFDKTLNSYTVTAPSDANFVQIKATTDDENSSVSGTGIKELASGVNHFDIVVTADDGSVNTYGIDIVKDISSNNYLDSLIPSEGVLSPSFDKDTLEYTLEVEYETDMLSFIATPSSNLSTVKGIENSVVPEGNSTRLIVVTAEDGSVRTYKVNVIKETASNALLESLLVDGYELEFDPNTFTYNLQVSRNKSELLESEITAIAKDVDATVNMMGDLTLVNGMVNVYVIEVIAKDGYTTQQYTLNVTRDSSDYTLRSEVYKIVRSDEETYTEDNKTYRVIDEDYVIGIEPDTELEEFVNNFLNEEKDMIHVYNLGEVEITTGLVGTAYKVKLESDTYVYDELVIIVRGDLTKDGKVNITDQAQMIGYIGKSITFDKYQELAADITKDGRVNITDQAQIISYIGKAIKDIN